ncbi:competence protein CoiA [Heyndrickxia ginsengihumi]|uniref:competence protein CoiA n=1 Tax=Heyndrickxia ginsengihumi TaxID=363870 RepID=UPI003D26096B
MFTAMNQDGECINLLFFHKRESLRELKEQQTFFCCHCYQPVLLKIGKYKLPHFAHVKNNNCLYTSKHESFQHLQAKKDFYEWLKRQLLEPQVETFISVIQQKADLLVKLNRQLFAIEYQCSKIPMQQIIKRTKGYLEEHIIPVWILGGLPYQKVVGEHRFQLTDFQMAFIRYDYKKGFYLFSYSPQNRQFHILTQLMPVSLTTVIANITQQPLYSITFPLLAHQLISTSMNNGFYEKWFQLRKEWIHTKLKYGKGFKDPFLREVYLHDQHPLYLPAIIGLPLKQMMICREHAIEWQFYYWIDNLRNLKNGQALTFKQIHENFRKRMEQRYLHLRHFPLIYQDVKDEMLHQYTQLLIRLGYLKEVKKRKYIMNKSIPIPKNMEEVIRMEKKLKLEFFAAKKTYE